MASCTGNVKTYELNILYNEAEFKNKATPDTELSLKVTKHLANQAESWGYSKSYYTERDALPGQNKYNEHFFVTKNSVFTFVVITPDFHKNKWAMYKQMSGFDCLMKKDEDGFLYGIAVGVEELPTNMCLSNYVAFRKEDWETDEEKWKKIQKMMDRYFKPQSTEAKTEHGQPQSAVSSSTLQQLSVDGVPGSYGIIQEQSVHSSSSTVPSGSFGIGPINMYVGKDLIIHGDAFSNKTVRATDQSNPKSAGNSNQLPKAHDTSLENPETTRIKTLHHEMLQKLNDYIDPKVKSQWDRFLNMINIHLAPTVRNSCDNLFDICENLLINGVIEYGDYAFLTEAFETIQHTICCSIIKEYTKKIRDIRDEYADFTDSKTTNEKMNMQSVIEKNVDQIQNENDENVEENKEIPPAPVSEAMTRTNTSNNMPQLSLEGMENDQARRNISSYEGIEEKHPENVEEEEPTGESGIGSSLSASPDTDGTNGEDMQPERPIEPVNAQTNPKSRIFRLFSKAFLPLCHIWNKVEQPYF